MARRCLDRLGRGTWNASLVPSEVAPPSAHAPRASAKPVPIPSVAVGGGRLDVRPSKSGSSSAMEDSGLGDAPPCTSMSWRATCLARMARCSSRSVRNVNCAPADECTTQRSPLASDASGRRTLNSWPHAVHRTVVPRPLTSASSKTYSVWQRSHFTSIDRVVRSGRGGGAPHSHTFLARGPLAGSSTCPWRGTVGTRAHANTRIRTVSIDPVLAGELARTAPSGTAGPVLARMIRRSCREPRTNGRRDVDPKKLERKSKCARCVCARQNTLLEFFRSPTRRRRTQRMKTVES